MLSLHTPVIRTLIATGLSLLTLAADAGVPVPPAPPDAAAAPRLDPGAPLDIAGATEFALQRHPELTAMAWHYQAMAARAQDAGLRPNPQLEVTLEDFAGTGAAQALDSVELTVLVGQVIERHGKRLRRQEVAQRGTDIAAWQYHVTRSDVAAGVAAAFLAVLAADARTDQAGEAARVSSELQGAIERRAAAGEIPPISTLQSELDARAARLSLRQHRAARLDARRQLALAMGDAALRPGTVTGDLYRRRGVPDYAVLRARLAGNPELARARAEADRDDARARLARAGRYQDLRVEGGVRYLGEGDDVALVAGISVPLRWFNPGNYAVTAAEGSALGARAGVDGRALTLEQVLGTLYGRYTQATLAAEGIETELLPLAEQRFAAYQQAFDSGFVSVIELLDAYRRLLAVQSDRVDALVRHHQGAIELERLTGRPLPEIAPGP